MGLGVVRMVGFALLRMGSPYDRGYANGYLLAPEIKEVFHMLDFNFMDNYGLSREFFSEVIPAPIWRDN